MTNQYETLAKLYAAVFAPSPWNEYTRCWDEDKFFGLETKPGEPCPNCGKTLGEAYPLDWTLKYIDEELGKKDAQLITKEYANELIGFGWGYVEPVRELVVAKYKNTQPVIEALKQDGIMLDEEVFYLSETGVRDEYRKRGFASAITQGLLGLAKEMQLNTVMRTNKDSPMVRIATKTNMLALPMEDPDGRPDRVLFTKKVK